PEAPPHQASKALGDSPVWQPPTGPREGVVFTCPHHPEVVSESPGVCPKCHMDLLPQEKEAGDRAHHAHPDHGDGRARYVCPHHPEVTSDSPGTCSKCGGMALVPVKQEASGSTSGTTWFCPHHPEVTSESPGTCSKCGGMALVPKTGNGADARSEQTWVCPHHPEVTSHAPGTCSKCGGVALVPVKKEAQP